MLLNQSILTTFGTVIGESSVIPPGPETDEGSDISIVETVLILFASLSPLLLPLLF